MGGLSRQHVQCQPYGSACPGGQSGTRLVAARCQSRGWQCHPWHAARGSLGGHGQLPRGTVRANAARRSVPPTPQQVPPRLASCQPPPGGGSRLARSQVASPVSLAPCGRSVRPSSLRVARSRGLASCSPGGRSLRSRGRLAALATGARCARGRVASLSTHGRSGRASCGPVPHCVRHGGSLRSPLRGVRCGGSPHTPRFQNVPHRPEPVKRGRVV